MLDIKLIEKNPDYFKKHLRRRGENVEYIDEVIKLNSTRKNLITQKEKLLSERRSISITIGHQNKTPTPDQVKRVHIIVTEIKQLEKQILAVEEKLQNLLLIIPNLPQESIPDGFTEDENVLLKQSDHETVSKGMPHWDIAEKLNLYDLRAGASISGARFPLLKGKGSILMRALGNWMLDFHISRGYTEISPPLLVKQETMIGSGNLPKFLENLYYDTETDLWLVPTSEVALNGLFQNAHIETGSLPLKFVAHTACFRKEHTAAGKDVRGIKRVHQFQKVEIFRFETPENSAQALMEMVNSAVAICEALELPWRVLELCAGEIGFQASKTYDIEIYSAGTNEWLEVSSASNCRDFQTRRNNTRYRANQKDSLIFPHTLNASGLGLPRVWIALLENNLQNDGSVTIPEILHDYTKFEKICSNE